MTNISHIDHIAIAVHSIEEASEFYTKALGLSITKIEELPERGIRTAFIPIGQSMIELIEPIHDHSEISKFIAKKGPGIHHMALRTNNMKESMSQLKNQGARLTYDQVQPGAHGSKINFVHPASSGGILLELVSYD